MDDHHHDVDDHYTDALCAVDHLMDDCLPNVYLVDRLSDDHRLPLVVHSTKHVLDALHRCNALADHRRGMNVQYADDQLQLLDDLKFVLLDRDDRLSRVLKQYDHSMDDLKMVYHLMDDLHSIPHDLRQLHHVSRQNVPMKDVKKGDQNLAGHLMDDPNLDGQKMNALKIRHVKMKVGMNYYGHY